LAFIPDLDWLCCWFCFPDASLVQVKKVYNYSQARSFRSFSSIFMLLKSTTRHVRIFTAEVENNELVPSDNVLTLDVDPDNELNWNEEALQQVYRKFDELVESCSGEDLTEYNIRRIGSDLEHMIRTLLQSGQISYNLNSRVLNYSMGLSQVAAEG
jgi:NAD(P)H-quinone oxidoreductase subunit M